MLVLTVTDGPHKGDVHEIFGEELVSIGRDPERTVPLPRDRMCSSHHIDLISSTTGWSLEKKGANPAHLDDQPVTTCRLPSNARIRLGRTEIRVQVREVPCPAGYRYEGSLGEGSAGWVVLLRHRDTGEPAALKIRKPGSDPVSWRRFLREEKLLQGLPPHPHVARYLQGGEREGARFYLQEYVPGRNLESLLREEGPLPWPEAVALFRQVLEALEHAHRSRIIHRDVKPQNIMVDDSGTERRAVLTDFGLGTRIPTVEGSVTQLTRLTEDGTIPGTLGFLAPELLDGRPADARSDVFAAGASLYRALTGRYVYRFEAHPARAEAVAQGDIRLLTPQSAPRELCVIVNTATARDYRQRYPSASAMLTDLDALSVLMGSPDGGTKCG